MNCLKKLILEILAIQTSSGAVERLFSQCNIRIFGSEFGPRIEETVCRQKTWKFWFIMSRLNEIQSFEVLFFFIFQKKIRDYTRKYTIFFKIHEYT